MSRLLDTEVEGIHNLTAREFTLRLRLPANAEPPQPGQFYLLKPPCSNDPLLRRPFSAFRWGNDWIEFLIRKKGKATTLLGTLRSGDRISILGPLGRAFPEPGKTTVVIAGGIGIASVYSLAPAYRADHTLIYGARTSGELVFVENLKTLFRDVHLCTDDGSRGFHGSVVDCLREFLRDKDPATFVVYGCGPEGMTASLTGLLKEHNIEAYLSLEERMACGLGACMGCVRQTAEGMRRVCMEGPVFHIGEL